MDEVEFNFSHFKHLNLVQFHLCASDSCNLAHLNSDYLCLISIAVKTLVFPAAGNLNSPVLSCFKANCCQKLRLSFQEAAFA